MEKKHLYNNKFHVSFVTEIFSAKQFQLSPTNVIYDCFEPEDRNDDNVW